MPKKLVALIKIANTLGTTLDDMKSGNVDLEAIEAKERQEELSYEERARLQITKEEQWCKKITSFMTIWDKVTRERLKHLNEPLRIRNERIF